MNIFRQGEEMEWIGKIIEADACQFKLFLHL
jgi:hypothetical protein